MFATCSWPSLCEQSELQCWRRKGGYNVSAATDDYAGSANLRYEGATANIPILTPPLSDAPLLTKKVPEVSLKLLGLLLWDVLKIRTHRDDGGHPTISATLLKRDFSGRPSIDGLCFSAIISNRQPILHQP